jgi:hypothetical protein
MAAGRAGRGTRLLNNATTDLKRPPSLVVDARAGWAKKMRVGIHRFDTWALDRGYGHWFQPPRSDIGGSRKLLTIPSSIMSDRHPVQALNSTIRTHQGELRKSEARLDFAHPYMLELGRWGSWPRNTVSPTLTVGSGRRARSNRDDAPRAAAATVAYLGLKSALRPAVRIQHRVYNGAGRTRIAVEWLPRWRGRSARSLNRLLDAARSSRTRGLPAEGID